MSQPLSLYNVNQVAALLSKAAVTVRKAARDHGIGVKTGRDYVFTESDIERLRAVIHEHRGQPRKPKPQKGR